MKYSNLKQSEMLWHLVPCLMVAALQVTSNIWWNIYWEARRVRGTDEVAESTLGIHSFAKWLQGMRRREGAWEKEGEWKSERQKERQTQREGSTWESAQPFSCSSSSSTGQGSWKRRDYQGTGAVLAWAASAHSCTARYTALLKRWTWFSHTQTHTHNQSCYVYMLLIYHF